MSPRQSGESALFSQKRTERIMKVKCGPPDHPMGTGEGFPKQVVSTSHHRITSVSTKTGGLADTKGVWQCLAVPRQRDSRTPSRFTSLQCAARAYRAISFVTMSVVVGRFGRPTRYMQRSCISCSALRIQKSASSVSTTVEAGHDVVQRWKSCMAAWEPFLDIDRESDQPADVFQWPRFDDLSSLTAFS